MSVHAVSFAIMIPVWLYIQLTILPFVDISIGMVAATFDEHNSTFLCGNGFELNGSAVCNGKDDCGNWDDECNCYGDVDSLCEKHSCLSGGTTIKRRQFCDGIFDCPDLSDECLCNRKTEENIETFKVCSQLLHEDQHCCIGNFSCPQRGGIEKCIPGNRICDGIRNCENGIDEAFCENRKHNLSQHSHIHNNNRNVTSRLCDGTIDFPDGSDELHCSKYFYCTKDKEVYYDLFEKGIKPGVFGDQRGIFIDWRRRFDKIKDCDGGIDEWSQDFLYCFTNWESEVAQQLSCTGNASLEKKSVHGKGIGQNCQHHPKRVSQSSEYLVASLALNVIYWIFGILAVTLNSIVMVHLIFSSMKNGCSKKSVCWVKSANRLFVFNVAAIDFSVGLSLVVQAILNSVWAGEYWKHAEDMSNYSVCKFMAFYIVAFVEVSVLIYACLTGIRLYTILFPYKQIKMCFIYLLFFLCWTMPLTITIFFVIDSLEFVSIPHLPQTDAVVLEKDQVKEIVRRGIILNSIYAKSYPIENYVVEDPTFPQLNAILAGINYEFGRWRRFGTYSSNALCIPRLIVRVGEPGWDIMAMILAVDCTIYLFICIAYFIILRESTSFQVKFGFRKRREKDVSSSIQDSSTPIPSTRKQRTSRNKEDKILQRRLFWMIMTNLLAWFPLVVCNLISIIDASIKIRTRSTEALLLALVFGESAMNPVFYSRTVRKIFHRALGRPTRKLMRKMRQSLIGEGNNGEG